MSRVWLDGFDQYNNSTDLLAGSYTSQNSCTLSANSRTGGKAVQIFAAGTGHLTKQFTAANRFVLGAAVRCNNVVDSADITMLGTTGTIFGTRLGNNGLPQVYWDNVAIWTSPETRQFANTYSYYEFDIQVNNGAGNDSIEFRYNGSPVVTISGLTYNANLDRMRFRTTAGTSITQLIDDVYLDTNTFLGAQRCYTRFVDSDQTPQDWALSGGASAFQLLNDVPYNTANYIQTDIIGNKSRFGIEDLPALNSIVNGGRLCSVQALSAAGSGSTRQRFLDSGGTTIHEGSDKALSTSQIFYNDVFDLAGYSVADINSSMIEIEKMS